MLATCSWSRRSLSSPPRPMAWEDTAARPPRGTRRAAARRFGQRLSWSWFLRCWFGPRRLFQQRDQVGEFIVRQIVEPKVLDFDRATVFAGVLDLRLRAPLRFEDLHRFEQ